MQTNTEKLPLATIITAQQQLENLVERLKSEPLIAVDTESNSLFAYHQRVCLIQMSTRQADWIIDPLAIADLSALGVLFADPKIEKVFHAAEYDIMCMKRDYNFSFANLFDTMVSARILGIKTLGLGSLLETYFGIHVDKRFQRADWSLRPIPMDQLRYAQRDTHFLAALRDTLMALMQEKGRLAEAREVFAQMSDIPPAAPYTFDPEGFWRINAARNLDRRQMAILRELYIWRDSVADKLDRPPFKVMNDEFLVDIAREMPENLDEMGQVVSRNIIDRYGPALLAAVKHGQVAKLPTRPGREPRLDPETQARFDALHEWRKTRAIERGVESDVIIPKEALWAIARSGPRTLDDLDQIPGLGPWKKEKYATEILKLIATIGHEPTA